MPAKPNPEESLYVNLKKPLELRRNILECSKDVLYTLQKIEKIKNLRNEKTELIKKLKVQIGEINILTTKLAEHLPDYAFSVKQAETDLANVLSRGRKKNSTAKQEKGKKSKSKKGKKAKKKEQPKKNSKNGRSVAEQLAKVQGKLRGIRN